MRTVASVTNGNIVVVKVDAGEESAGAIIGVCARWTTVVEFSAGGEAEDGG